MSKTLVFTGHRPSGLGNVYDHDAPVYYNIGSAIRGYIVAHPEFTNFIDGGAQGGDRTFERVVAKLKRSFPGRYTNEIAIPCLDHEKKWPKDAQVLYNQMLKLADVCTLVCPVAYNNQVMQIRNMYMIMKSDAVLALWAGITGGTYNAIVYALQSGKPVHVINPVDWKEYDLTPADLQKVIEIGMDTKQKSAAQVKASFQGPKVYIQTDGSCAPNPGPGGWASEIMIGIKGQSKTVNIEGFSVQSTNNIMEMTAILEAFKALDTIPETTGKKCLVTVRSDSKYCINALDSWIKTWKANAVKDATGKDIWKTGTKQPVANQDIWEELDALRDKHECIFEYIPREQNANLDERAKAQTAKAKEVIAAAAAMVK